MSEMTGVIWKMVTVNGLLWPSYQVSSEGEIRSLPRPKIVMRQHGNNEYKSREIWNLKGKKLKRIYPTPESAPCVHLYGVGRNAKRVDATVKRIVAESFIVRDDFDDIPTQRIVNIDGDPSNCSVSNIGIIDK